MSRILLSAYACEPGKGSEPEVGWMWATELAAAGHEVWAITRAANRKAIEGEMLLRAAHEGNASRLNFVYYDLPLWVRHWKRGGRGIHWYYPLWQLGAYQVARRLTRTMQFDCVQHVTFVGLRAPSLMGFLGLPFILGPVSGGEVVPRQLRVGMSLRAKLQENTRDAANAFLRLDPVMRLIFRKADKILVATEDSRALVPRDYREKCEIQLAVGLSRQYLGWSGPGLRKPGSALRLLYAGRLLEWKGVNLALRAVQKLKLRVADVRFTIIGSGPAEKKLNKMADELGLGDTICWLPWVGQDELKKQYAQHDLLLFPSLRDSGGMVVLESLAHGLPVVCTDCGGPGEIVSERCGRIVQTMGRTSEEVVDGLADALLSLSTSPELLKKLSRGARARAWDFDFRRVVTKWHPFECDSEATHTTQATVCR